MDGLNYGTYYFFRTLAKDTPELHGVIRGVDWLGSVGVLAAVGLLLVALLAWRRRTHAAPRGGGRTTPESSASQNAACFALATP